MEAEAESLIMQAAKFTTQWQPLNLSGTTTLGQGLKDLLSKFTQELKGETPRANSPPPHPKVGLMPRPVR